MDNSAISLQFCVLRITVYVYSAHTYSSTQNNSHFLFCSLCSTQQNNRYISVDYSIPFLLFHTRYIAHTSKPLHWWHNTRSGRVNCCMEEATSSKCQLYGQRVDNSLLKRQINYNGSLNVVQDAYYYTLRNRSKRNRTEWNRTELMETETNAIFLKNTRDWK